MESIGDILGKYGGKAGPNGQNQSGVGTPGSDPTQEQLAPACETCGDIGWVRRDVPVGHPDFGETFPCSCTLARFDSERRDRLTKLSNLGALGGVTFDSLASLGIEGATVDQARAFAAAPAGWLVLLGPTGSGKTRLAAAIANQRIEAGEPVFFVTAADLLDHLRSTYAPDSDLAYDEMFEQVRSITLLVLDDLGDESATPWAKEKLAQVLTHRYNERLPTVITTPGPVEKLDERIAGRLADSAVSHVVRLGGRTPSSSTVEVLDTALPDLTFENFDPTRRGHLRGPMQENLARAFHEVSKYAKHPKEESLAIVGGPGCGKTHLMAAIAGYQREQGTDVLFVLLPRLLHYIRSTFEQPSRPAFEIIDRLGRAGLLLLDDLVVEKSSEWAWNTLDLILNQRMIARLPTVVAITTTGKDHDLSLIPPRIWSRLNDVWQGQTLVILAPDYRTGLDHASMPTEPASRRRPAKPRGS